MHTEHITGIILAGGRSSRMGRNKALIEINGEIMISTLHNLFKLFCTEIIISANNSEPYLFLNERIVPDEIKGIGPIGGILSCLKESHTQKNLVIACDMPMVPAGLIQQLIWKKDEADFIVPASGLDSIEPLCAIYDKSVISVLSKMISIGDYKVQHLQYYCKTALVQMYNGNNIFRNLNTPRDIIK
jgi:molybdopterin-guanine dinucleotide biosynthesis protein A